MNKLKEKTKLVPGEYLLLKKNLTRWSVFEVLDAKTMIDKKNTNIDYACAEAIKEAEKVAKEHNCELTDNQREQIKAEHEKMKFKFEEGLYFITIDEALKKGIIQKVENGYYMPTLDYKGMGIVNKLNNLKNAKKNKS